MANLAATIETKQSQSPAHRLVRVSGIDAHHDHFLLAAVGAIACITGMFGDLPGRDVGRVDQ